MSNNAFILQDYLLAKQLQGLSPTTLWAYEYAVGRMLREIDKDYQSITTSDLREYLMSLKVSDVSRSIYIKNLRVFWRWLVREGHKENNPMDRIPTPKVPQVFPKVINEADVVRLVRTAKKNPRDYSIILTLLDTGVRASELGAISRSTDLDLDGKAILIREGKGKKSRYVFFSDITARSLRRYLATRKDTDEALFLSQKGEPINRDSLRHTLYRLSDRAGLSKRISPQQLRATMATWYIISGGDPHSLRLQLGHTTIRMAEAYCFLAGSDVREIHSRCSPVKRVIGCR